MQIYIKDNPCTIAGFIVPLEFITGMTLAQVEQTIGLARGRLNEGAVIVQLREKPAKDDLEYFGDTYTAAHHFDTVRNKEFSQEQLNNAAYSYIQPGTRLVKVIPLKNPDPMGSEDSNWPRGRGAMQFKLKRPSLGIVLAVINDYSNGRIL